MSDMASFSTVRTRQSALWLVNNRNLEDNILGYQARYSQRYNVKVYAMAIEGSHVHDLCHYPNCNRSDYKRDLNSMIARSINRNVPNFPGGSVWERRYSVEFVPGDEDIEDKFFYIALQPVKDGLVEKISEYPFYHFFNDAINGHKRKVKVVRWEEYNNRRRWNKTASILDYTDWYVFQYERLPGYQDLTQTEYKKLMLQKLEERRLRIVAKRKAEGKGFLGRERLLRTIPGTLAKNPKVSTRTSHRPRILSRCNIRRQKYTNWYFSMYFSYKAASRAYRAGDDSAEFPPGMYKPPKFTVKYSYHQAA